MFEIGDAVYISNPDEEYEKKGLKELIRVSLTL